jgi:hypothetical protein
MIGINCISIVKNEKNAWLLVFIKPLKYLNCFKVLFKLGKIT